MIPKSLKSYKCLLIGTLLGLVFLLVVSLMPKGEKPQIFTLASRDFVAPKTQKSHKEAASAEPSYEPPVQNLAEAPSHCFATAEARAQLKEQIFASGSYRSLHTQQRTFQHSRFDTRENYQGALAQLFEAYPQNLADEMVTARVLALNFLAFSQHLKKRDCSLLLQGLIAHYTEAVGEQQRQALQLDVSGVVYACVQVGGQEFRRKIESLTIAELKAQAHNALVVYNEDVHKS